MFMFIKIRRGEVSAMLNIRHTCPKSKGFTLIEVILSLAICAIIIIPIFSILDFTIDACTIGDEKDELILNGRHAIEYIKNEIKSADKIISSDKFKDLKSKYPTNIGFVILMYELDGKYRYMTYHTKDKKVIRIACTRDNNKYPSENYFSGHNEVCDLVDSIGDTKFDQDMIYLDFKFKKNNSRLSLKSDIYVRCPIDY